MSDAQPSSETDNGLVYAYLLNGDGTGTPYDWPAINSWTPEKGLLWVHLDRSHDQAKQWIEDTSGMPALAQQIMLANESRPRSVSFKEGLAVTLRGVNLNPGENPEDMVSLRLWLSAQMIVTVRTRQLMAVREIRAETEEGMGPNNPGDMLVAVANKLVDRMGPVIDELSDTTDRLEDEMIETESREIRSQLHEIRHQTIGLRRYLAPQRDAIARLNQENQPWLTEGHKLRLRETTDRVLRIVEELDEVRERAAVVQDELVSRNAEQMNRTMYVLTVVAGILLPLSFITGLLGINVGGMPGVENKTAFAIVCIILVVMGVGLLWAFKRWKWI